MVFDRQNPQRRTQNMSALLAIVIMIGLILPIPVGAGFADWLNEVNAPTALEDKYVALNATGDPLYEMDLYNGTGWKNTFSWTNGSKEGQKHYVENDGTGVLEATLEDTDGNPYTYTDPVTDDSADWEEQVPVWLITFDYTAKQAYADNVVLFHVKIVDLNGIENAEDAEETGVTVQLIAGGVTFGTWTLAFDDNDNEIDENITITADALRSAIIGGGATSYFTLKVVGHGAFAALQADGTDPVTLDITGTDVYTYQVAKLFGRDDGLYLAAMISTILAALGIFLVTPKYNLPWKGRGF